MMKYMKNILLALFVLVVAIGCENTGEVSDWETPRTTQLAHTPEFSEDARAAGNDLFGSVENPTRIPSGLELAAAMEPSIGRCEQCADNAYAVTRGNFGPDPRYQVSLKNYPRPSHGCTPYTDVSLNQAESLIASQNLSTRNATEREKRVLGASIKRVQELNGGPLRTGMGPGGGYPFVYKDENGSNQRAGQINIGRNIAARGHNHYGNSVAQQVHEWAHLIGNNGVYQRLRSYMRGAGDCHVSNYALSRPNEHFAEVFTAFVTEPATLLNNTRTPAACRRAFDFFKNEFFNRGDRVTNCIPHPLR